MQSCCENKDGGGLSTKGKSFTRLNKDFFFFFFFFFFTFLSFLLFCFFVCFLFLSPLSFSLLTPPSPSSLPAICPLLEKMWHPLFFEKSNKTKLFIFFIQFIHFFEQFLSSRKEVLFSFNTKFKINNKNNKKKTFINTNPKEAYPLLLFYYLPSHPYE